MSNNESPLLAKLRTLECHFTWDIKLEAVMEMDLLLIYLIHKEKHTPYCNHGVYVALRAFLYYSQRHYAEALRSLQEAEEVLKQEHPTNFLLHTLVTYGNYAWVYYQVANFPKVEFYLGEIHKVCLSLNSPEPYSVPSPEVMSQKGWSFLVVGPPGGEAAMNCFQMALREDPSNEEFKGGLATSLYFSWQRSRTTCRRDAAQNLLEEIALTQPQNYEAKLYLANVLLDRGEEERANWYLEDVVENSLSAELLRQVATLCMQAKPQRVTQAISILTEAVSLEPSYHFLYYYLGMCYKNHMMEQASSEERAATLEAAKVNFQRAAETDSLFVFPMLELAKIYGETVPAYEEEIYLRLMQQISMVSQECQESICLCWGDFLLHKKGEKHKALEVFLVGLKVPGSFSKEKDLLKKRLAVVARMFQEDSEMDRVDFIHGFLQTMGREEDNSQAEDLWQHIHCGWR